MSLDYLHRRTDITALVAVEFLRVVKHPIPEGYANLLAWLERMAWVSARVLSSEAVPS